MPFTTLSAMHEVLLAFVSLLAGETPSGVEHWAEDLLLSINRDNSEPFGFRSRQAQSPFLTFFYRPPAFSIALIIIFFASSPERFVTVKCATDCRRRVFFLASTAISVIWIATRGALRSTIMISRSFSLATVHLQHAIFMPML